MAREAIDITGNKYNRLTAIKLDHIKRCSNGRAMHYWLFQCDCGNTTVTRKCDVIRGTIKSCGCYRLDMQREKNTTHGESSLKLYGVWNGMIQRCTNENAAGYINYGGRGVSIDKAWGKYEQFAKWAKLNGCQEGMQIDRIDNNGNYGPNNCRWVTRSENNKNKRTNKRICYNGLNLTYSEWAKRLNGPKNLISRRIKEGWNEIDAVSTPIKDHARRHCKTIEYNGECLTYTDWSLRLSPGNKLLVSTRIRMGWDKIAAITTPVKRKAWEESRDI
jgi:hypothetical protein